MTGQKHPAGHEPMKDRRRSLQRRVHFAAPVIA